jgi:hypothetical protein
MNYNKNLPLGGGRTLADGRINPSNYKNANQTNEKLADIALPNFQMSSQSR